MSKGLKLALVFAVFVLLVLIGAPVVSADMWKSSMIDKSNIATDAINKTAGSVKEFDANPNASSADFDVLLAAYRQEKGAIQTAREQAKTVGGFKGVDVTGQYQQASKISANLMAIYDELLSFNASEIASAEAEKQIILAFESSDNPDDAMGMQVQAQNIRKANNDYQKHLSSGQATEVDHKLSAVLTKLADALENTSQAIAANNLAQINNADAQLQAVLKTIDALDAEISAQTALKQQKIQAIVDRLNKASEELE